MRRTAHGGTDGEHFDLLPLITMLVCTLGCLLLVTMGSATLGLGPGVDEGWAPSQDIASGTTKTPILIEWNGDTLIAHLGKRRTDYGLSEKANAFVADLADYAETHYAFFAVRPSGFSTFNGLARVFREHGIEVGYEPLAQDTEVKLTTTTDLP